MLLGSRTWFSKHQVYIVIESVVRVEIACSKPLTGLLEAVLNENL